MNTDILIVYLINIPVIMIAVTIHEFTKAAASSLLGDRAPKADRRLTLNPFKHFEPIGFIFLMFFGYGWGKPVRTSGVYYKNRTLGTVITYTAPIIANFVFSFIFAVLGGFLGYLALGGNLNEYVYVYGKRFLSLSVTCNLSLALFNIIPVAPLCANRIMTALMTPGGALKVTHYEKIFQIILVMLLMFGIVDSIFSPVIRSIVSLYNYVLMIWFA